VLRQVRPQSAERGGKRLGFEERTADFVRNASVHAAAAAVTFAFEMKDAQTNVAVAPVALGRRQRRLERHPHDQSPDVIETAAFGAALKSPE
jgi:hypothetical protein